MAGPPILTISVEENVMGSVGIVIAVSVTTFVVPKYIKSLDLPAFVETVYVAVTIVQVESVRAVVVVIAVVEPPIFAISVRPVLSLKYILSVANYNG